LAVLLFGFERFLGFDENPTELVARRLDGRAVSGERIVGKVLPVDYLRIEEAITDAMEKHPAVLALGLGLAAGREKVTPEKVAINYRGSGEADNAGRRLPGSPIDPAQPDGLFSLLPVESLVDALNAGGVPAVLSLSAGSYLCNNAMFVLVREGRARRIPAGFVHVPCHSEWVDANAKSYPSLPLSTLERAAEMTIEHCLRAARAAPVR
jgi:pyroglutamyl-peptidase